jgi:hypothetical protein
LRTTAALDNDEKLANCGRFAPYDRRTAFLAQLDVKAGEMIVVGDTVTNRAICDEFGVGIMGGIRVSGGRNTIVLVSNNTDETFINTWSSGVLHFVGRGAVGPQKLTAQNRTLANSSISGARVHLFEVFEKGQYVYAGQVELAGEPYRSEQVDARSAMRFVWKFPLRRKIPKPLQFEDRKSRSIQQRNHLPPGAYAVIDSELSPEQCRLVDEMLDRLKRNGISTLDQRDIDENRHRADLARWHEKVLTAVRRRVRSIIAKEKRRNKHSTGLLADDELLITRLSSEQELREALRLLGYEDTVLMENIFEEARQTCPMPETPASLAGQKQDGEGSIPDLPGAPDPRRFDGYT